MASIVLPSVISHLLQLLRGQGCHLGTTLLQSCEFSWTQDCEHQSRTETRIQTHLSNSCYLTHFSTNYKKIIRKEDTNTSPCHLNYSTP